jgi:hypothetical protein
VTVARRLAELVRKAAGVELPVRIRAWDGTEAGPADGPVLVIRSRRALRRLLWAPGERGLARAYVTGDLDVEGDIVDGFRRAWAMSAKRRTSVSLRDKAGADLSAARIGAVGLLSDSPATFDAVSSIEMGEHVGEGTLETFERHDDEFVSLRGEEVARVWRLYLVGGGLAFEQGRMGVDQILARKP